jgi:N6-L-threonylcarbamoyladenine synthase
MAKVKDDQRELKILGIETSCDETSVALLSYKVPVFNIARGGHVVASGSSRALGSEMCREIRNTNGEIRLKKHYIATQIPIHARYGGVVPEVAARTHVAEIVSLLDKTLGLSKKDKRLRMNEKIDFVAVTQGPGLATALRVGIESAKMLSWLFDKPLIPINHLEGHLASAWLEPSNRKKWEFPILFLLVSGGHTELVLMTDFGKYKILGRTRDDAAGEAFDKTAKMLGLEYPGGPKLSKLAVEGNPQAYNLPRPMLHDPSLDFSFSGLKTAVRVLLLEQFGMKDKRLKIKEKQLKDICASIQEAIVDVLVAKTVKAALKFKPRAFAVVGGVSANKKLQLELKKALKKSCSDVVFLKPAKGLHTDNGAMIAAAGLWNIIAQKKISDWRKVDAKPELDL